MLKHDTLSHLFIFCSVLKGVCKIICFSTENYSKKKGHIVKSTYVFMKEKQQKLIILKRLLPLFFNKKQGKFFNKKTGRLGFSFYVYLKKFLHTIIIHVSMNFKNVLSFRKKVSTIFAFPSFFFKLG